MISESVRVGRDSEPRAGLHRDRCSAAQRWRPGLQWPAGAGQMLDSGMAAGPRHGRQQFLKQEFGWKNRDTIALLSMRTSLAAAGSQPCHGPGDCQWQAFKFLHWQCPAGRQTSGDEAHGGSASEAGPCPVHSATIRHSDGRQRGPGPGGPSLTEAARGRSG